VQEFNLQDVKVLNSFDANAMATILAEKRHNGTMHEHSSLNKGTKDLGMTLPLFKGNQNDWKNWNKKFRMFLNQQGRSDGKLYIYVIVDLAKENQSIQDQCKGTKLSGQDLMKIISRYHNGYRWPWQMAQPFLFLQRNMIGMAIWVMKNC